ncbi:hypothetical protein [Vampirovibrio chlorellavorus]|uniref:hypothetical protein n=1 Tax=Vampirovibrio chlorellavorus TaxID=758823 RepID=UPI0026EAF581|nr:hypothetical protein [Vampirovibrio chlorellavorus]
MISSIAHRPVYTPNPLRTGTPSRSLPQSSVRFGHGPGHVHADGQACSDKNCTEGQKGERQSRFQQFFDWVKATWQKFKDFCASLFGQSKPQETTTTAASTPAVTATPAPAEQPATQTSHKHESHTGHDHKHGQCCGKKHSHSH